MLKKGFYFSARSPLPSLPHVFLLALLTFITSELSGPSYATFWLAITAFQEHSNKEWGGAARSVVTWFGPELQCLPLLGRLQMWTVVPTNSNAKLVTRILPWVLYYLKECFCIVPNWFPQLQHFIEITDNMRIWGHQANKPGTIFIYIYITDMPGVDPTGNDFWEVDWWPQWITYICQEPSDQLCLTQSLPSLCVDWT